MLFRPSTAKSHSFKAMLEVLDSIQNTHDHRFCSIERYQISSDITVNVYDQLMLQSNPYFNDLMISGAFKELIKNISI